MKNKKVKDNLENELNEEEQLNELASEEKNSVTYDSSALEIAEKKIEELELHVKELNDRLLRKAAEFENYKRRTENDQLNLLSYAAESFITRLLPVVDDFERSLQHIDDINNDSIKTGIKLVYEKLLKVLNDQGVKKMESVGKPFNVNEHDALMQRKDDTFPPHTVLEEIEKGYLYKDKVIRHAKVIVSEETSAEDFPQENDKQNFEDNPSQGN